MENAFCTQNFFSGLATIREDSFDGRACIVAPVVMMTEGVHCNNLGAVFYSAEELGREAQMWNMRPVVLDHPEIGGKPISACSKEVVEAQSVGVLLNTEMDGKKLRSEAWLYKDKLPKELVFRLKSGNMMEVSTGHFGEYVNESGEWNGETFTIIAKSILPDHLALLPNDIGACSIADGAGIPRINRSYDLRTNKAKLSHEDLRNQLRDALPQPSGDFPGGPWIEAVFDNAVVYELNGTLFRRGYSVADGVVSLGDGPEEVRREVNYVAMSQNKEKGQMPDLTPKQKELVDNIVANGYPADLRAGLEGLSEEALTAISAKFQVNEAASEGDSGQGTSADAAGDANGSQPETEQTEKVVTMKSYLESAPAEIRETLEEGLAALNRRRTTLIQKITANKSNPFSKEELAVMKVNQLDKLATLAGADFSGNGEPAMAANSAEEPLTVCRVGEQK